MNGLAVDHVAKGILRLDSCLMTGLCLRMVVELAGTFAAELLGVRDNLRPEQEATEPMVVSKCFTGMVGRNYGRWYIASVRCKCQAVNMASMATTILSCCSCILSSQARISARSFQKRQT